VKQAVGIVEFKKITSGIVAADAMCKAAAVEIITAQAICPGKYLILVAGDVGAVNSAVAAAAAVTQESDRVASFVIPNLQPGVIPALKRQGAPKTLRALGGLECYSVAAAIVAADAAVKCAPVTLIEVRLARFMGGKAVVTLTGDVEAVTLAIGAGRGAVPGKVIDSFVLPSPHSKLGTVIF